MNKKVLFFLLGSIICLTFSDYTNSNMLLAKPNLTSEQGSTNLCISNLEENYNKVHKAALVLEGGSLRSVYTSGVLDVLMENGIQFELIVAVSAGALNAGNFVANHIGRSARINILHSNDSKYYGFRQLIFHRRAFNFKYIFYSPINDLYPYDEEALKNSRQRLLIAATNIQTGNAEYFERYTYNELVHVLQASSSIPLLSQPVDIEGNFYLDGATADPIGLHKAFSEGFKKVVLVLPNHADFRLPPPSWLERIMIKLHNHKYPKLMETIRNRHLMYNSLIDEINDMEKENQVFVIRPKHEYKIKAMEKDARKLFELYFQGQDDMRRLLPEMIDYLKPEEEEK
jgi:predicted patatin/cPLA2 family phospholipase